MEDLEKKIEEKAKEKQTADNQTNTQTIEKEYIHEMVESAKDPKNAVRFEVSNTVANKLRTPEVQKRVSGTADKVVDANLAVVENEANKAVLDSNTETLDAYFNEHKEELATAGIEQYTYMEDMKRAVKWHRVCAKIHWLCCGWWMTLIRTFFMKAKPFKWFLNTIGVLLNIGLIAGVVWLVIKLVEIL